MGYLDEGCDVTKDKGDIDWAKEPLITLMEAAKAGMEGAEVELLKRQAQMERDIAILSSNLKLNVNEIED